jgi:hypothetical protein
VLFKTAILTAHDDNFKELADLVIPNTQKYCDKHGYGFFVYKIESTEHYQGFYKLQELLNLLSFREFDLVWCVDMDVLITNHSIALTDFIDQDNELYITKDVNGINAGSFIIKNTAWAKLFLMSVLDLMKDGKFECEQDAINYLVEACWDRVKFLPHPSINSYIYDEYGAPKWGRIKEGETLKPTIKEGNWERGCFALHMPGVPQGRRVEIVKNILNEK